MSENLKHPVFERPTCRGSYRLGSACRNCERCSWEASQYPERVRRDRKYKSEAARIVSEVYNAHRNSDLRADNPDILNAFKFWRVLSEFRDGLCRDKDGAYQCVYCSEITQYTDAEHTHREICPTAMARAALATAPASGEPPAYSPMDIAAEAVHSLALVHSMVTRALAEPPDGSAALVAIATYLEEVLMGTEPAQAAPEGRES